MSGERQLAVEIFTPSGQNESFSCDSLHLTLSGDANGRSGGDTGIHPGHYPALMALSPGPVTGLVNGEQVFRRLLGSGLAEVDRFKVTILADSSTKE